MRSGPAKRAEAILCLFVRGADIGWPISLPRSIAVPAEAENGTKRLGWMAPVPPVLHRASDDIHSRLERGFYIHFRRIEQVGIVSRFERSDCAAAVALVAPLQVAQHLVVICRPALGLELGSTPARTHRGGGRDIEFHRSIGADNSTDVAAI